jgi:hypothetical protein
VVGLGARTEAGRRTYLAEHYRPGSTADELRRCGDRVRESLQTLESAGEPVRYLRSTFVLRDESFFCVLEAGSEELVHEAYARAGVALDRLSLAVTDEDVEAKRSEGPRRREK